MRAGILLLLLLSNHSSFLLSQAKAAQDNWIGVWKMNPVRSKYQSGTLPKSRTLNFQAVTNGVKATSDLLDDLGAVHIEFTASFDGKDVPMRGTNQGNTIAAERVDAYTFETVQKTNGQVTITTRFAVSRDGRSLTATSSGLDPDGVKFMNVAVYDKIER